MTMKPWRPGFYPFWFWNDVLTEAEICWQIREMASQGIKGFFIHSRQGLTQPYLSETFFQMVETAVLEAEAQGMTAHLYDEYPYPSGVAGGEIILGNPEFQATRLVQKTYDVPGGAARIALPRGKILSCVACPLHGSAVEWDEAMDIRAHIGMVLTDESYNEVGLTAYNRKRYFASQPTPVLEIELPPQAHRIFVSAQTVVSHHKYWDGFVDVLHPEAVQAFIAATHERYFTRFGSRFGTVIPSIFVDETEPGWSSRLPQAFLEEYGDDLLPLLPALQDTRHPQHLKTVQHLAHLKYKLFCACFDEPLSRWCAEHNLRYTGEKPSLRLAQLRYMDVPGCDVGHTKAGAPPDLLGGAIRSNARAAASAAYFYGKEGALCEAYHSLGWSATLQDIKLIAESLLLHGVTYLVPHGFFYSTHALKKHDAPPTFFFQMPYWPLFHHLSEHMEKLTSYLAGTAIDAQVLVVEPSSGLPTQNDRQSYADLLQGLMEEQVEFLLVDTDILESGTLKDGYVEIKDITASVVLVPPMQLMEAALQEWLASYEQAGGTVVYSGEYKQSKALVQKIRHHITEPLQITASSGDLKNLQVTARRSGQQRLWFMINTGRDALQIEMQANIPLKEIAIDSNQPVMLQQIQSDTARRALAPYESVLLESALSDAEIQPIHIQNLRLSGPFQVRPLNKNLLRLYEWQMSLEDSSGHYSATRMVPAVPLANQLKHSKLEFTPEITQFFGAPPELSLPELQVRYIFTFQNNYSGPVELVMEPGSLKGDWQIQINHAEAITDTDFAPTATHVRGSLGKDITADLNFGVNEITVLVKTSCLDGGLRNALYLAGDFGVSLALLTLTKRSGEGHFEQWSSNSLPFYAGTIEYEQEITLPEAPDREESHLELSFEQPFESAAEVSLDHGPWQPLLWSPRRVCLPHGLQRHDPVSLRIRVCTALERSFEGQEFDIDAHAYRNIR